MQIRTAPYPQLRSRINTRYMSEVRFSNLPTSALGTTKIGETLNPLDKGNPWAVYDNYIDRVAAQCVNTLTPKWSTKLAGYDVFIWDQCYSMEQTLRID